MATKTESQEPQDPIGLINQKLESRWMSAGRAKLEKQWLKCVAYAKGVQDDRYSFTGSGTFSSGGAKLGGRKKDRKKYTSNKIKPYLMRRLAQLVSAPPGWECQPRSTDFSDRQASEMAMDCLNHLYYDRRFFEKFSIAAWWSSVCGFSIIRPAWHPAIGDPQELFFNPDPTAPNEVLPEEILPDQVKTALREQGYVNMIPTGELDLKVFSPFGIVVPPTARDEYCPWTIEIEIVHVDELYDLYPSNVIDDAHRGASDAGGSLWLQNLTRVSGMLGPIAGFAEEFDDEEQIVVRRLFYRPCKRYPEGRYIVEAGGVPLVDSTNPYLEYGINQPHVWFRYAVEDGNLHSSGLVEDLVNPQGALNDIRHARIENTRMMGNPKWMVPVSSGVDRITNRHGAVIKYKGSQPPIPAKLDSIDNAGEQINQTLIQDMQDMGFQQDVTQAKVPANLRSGVAISLLQERDDAGITPVVRAWDRSVAVVGEYCLRIVAKQWPDKKALRLYGKDQSWDIRYFKSGVIDGRVVVVTPEERRAPKSRTLEMQKIFEGLESGVIDPSDPLARQEAMRSMELGGGWEKVMRAQQMNQRRANIENEIFAEMGPQGPDGYPDVEAWEDHAMHMAVHNELRLSDRWEALSSDVRLVLDAHCQKHQTIIEKQQQQQLEMMEAARGAPGTKGRASQPARQ